ncbi:MAG: hypothetical protein HC915_09485, partial [Anaerolineae bacterium]|nr:hypothetical protein [Anaerolineae bacterium]
MGQSPLPWMGVAILIGVAVAWLPLLWALALFGGAALLIAFLIEPALALIFTLCIAPLKALFETSIPLALPLDVGQLALGAFLGIWFVQRAASGEGQVHIAWGVAGGVALFWCAAGLSLWTAYSASAVLVELVKWAQILTLLVIVPNVRRWEWLVFGLLLSGALQGLLGLWQFIGNSGAPHLWILNYRFFRAFGTFMQPNPYAGFLGILLPLGVAAGAGAALDAWLNRPRRWEALLPPLVYLGMASLIGVGLLASWSRGA